MERQLAEEMGWLSSAVMGMSWRLEWCRMGSEQGDAWGWMLPEPPELGQ